MEEAKELLSKVITKLAEDATKTIVGKARDYFVDREKKEQIDLGYAYEEYLKKVYDTYSKSKSVIYLTEARELKKFFVPADLKYEKNMPMHGRISLIKSGDYTISGNDIRDVFKKSNKNIITGIGGIGKTMHMKHFCISAIELGYKIPVFIPLRWFNDCDIGEKPLEKLIYKKLEEFGFKLDEKYFQYSLESDKYLFLFDGYDEVSKAKINQISICIQRFSHRYSENSFIISSRQIDNIYGWDDYLVYSLCPLEFKDAVKLIWNLDYAVDMKKRFIDELGNDIYWKYKSIASVPILLSIMYMTYIDNAMIPETLGDFYERAFETMMFAHDRREKVGFEREFNSGLNYTDFKDVFRAFCFRSYFNDEYSFSGVSLIDNIRKVKGVAESAFDARAYKDDLVNITCMIIKDGTGYAFIHRSFQEYFAANFVSKMLEDEQREFCLDFLKTSVSKDYFTGDSLNGTSVITPYDDKVTDFFRVLHQINPKAFEYVILMPILKKIYCRYTTCKMDLVKTVASLFVLSSSGDGDEGYNDYLSFKNDLEMNERLTFQEFNLLCIFYGGSLKPQTSNEMREMINHNIGKWSCIDIIYSKHGCQGSDDAAYTLLALINTVIKRYSVLNKKILKELTFKERVNNPNFYTR